MIGRKDPLEYLRERVEWTEENVVKQRLKSHLISFDLLNDAHYGGLAGAELNEKLAKDFEAFLLDRAALVAAALNELARGDAPVLDRLWSNHISKRTQG